MQGHERRFQNFGHLVGNPGTKGCGMLAYDLGNS